MHYRSAGMFLAAATLLLILRPGAVSPADSPLTPEQRELLHQRDDLAIEAEAWIRDGEANKAIAVWGKKIELERKVFGPDHDEVVASLEWLAEQLAQNDDFTAAAKTLEEVSEIFRRRPG